MKKSELIESARQLTPPSVESVMEYREIMENLVKQVNHHLLTHDHLEELIGPGNEEMMMINHYNHGRFMECLFLNFDPTVFVESVMWVFQNYRTQGFEMNYWDVQLSAWVVELRKQLPQQSFEEIHPFYAWLIAHVNIFGQLSTKFLLRENSRHCVSLQEEFHDN